MRTTLAIALLACFGCSEPLSHLPPADVIEGSPRAGTHFDPATAGVVSGAVSWDGERPDVSPLRVVVWTRGVPKWMSIPNPNAPQISGGGGLAGAVVFLRGIDPAAATPWSKPPVEVHAADTGITIVPGGRVGFVPVGQEVEFRSESDAILGVRGRNADFFTLMLPDRSPARRRLDHPGRIELTSPANIYWAVADLFVCEHPYYTRTDETGRFELKDVPPGNYEAVCWVPNWEMAQTERDPESGAIFRAKYAPAVEVKSPVHIGPRGTAEVRLGVSTASFSAEKK